MGSDRIEAALERARDEARHALYSGPPRAPLGRTRRLAIGDPQAPLERFFEILDRHGALAADGRLDPELHLVSLGDHFDWGSAAEREQAAAAGLGILAWLAAHAPDQVTLVLGNHDLSRVGELAGFDAERFRGAQAEADRVYRDGRTDADLERAFLECYPELPSAEAAARDLSTFRPEQRTLVASLLRARRFCAAAVMGPTALLCHAGVTRDDLELAGLDRRHHSQAEAVAASLNDVLDRAVGSWPDGTSLSIPKLHEPGDARSGEVRGIFVQRPGDPSREHPGLFKGPPRRRFDPRLLPMGLTQAVGHIRDRKCRALLARWAAPEPALDGPIRHLRTDAVAVRYARGVPAPEHGTATLLFLDGGMGHADPAAYELLDLTTGMPAARSPAGG